MTVWLNETVSGTPMADTLKEAIEFTKNGNRTHTWILVDNDIGKILRRVRIKFKTGKVWELNP